MKYKAAFENQKGMMIGTDVTPEMALSKELEPIRSKKLYEADAKAALPHHNVDAGLNIININIHFINFSKGFTRKSFINYT